MHALAKGLMFNIMYIAVSAAALKERRTGVILEYLVISNVIGQNPKGLMTALLAHLKNVGTTLGGLGQKACTKRVARDLPVIKTSGFCARFDHDRYAAVTHRLRRDATLWCKFPKNRAFSEGG